MAGAQRRAIPSDDRERTVKVISAGELDDGKLNPQQGFESGIKPDDEEEISISKSRHFVPIIKVAKDEQIVTGVALKTGVVDAQGDSIPDHVVKDAAYNFLASFNRTTKLGFMHKKFNVNFQLLESYIAPQDLTINKKTIKKGWWVVTVKVLNSKVWKLIKEGKITGFSIGGKAKVKKITS